VSVPRLASRSDAEARDKARSAGRLPTRRGNGMFVIEVNAIFTSSYFISRHLANRRIQIVYSSGLVSFRMLEFVGL
jgi:hypothetical protein